MKRHLTLVMTLAIGALAGQEPKVPAQDPVLEKKIAGLIQDLGVDQFKVRDAATQELKRIGTPAEAALRRAYAETSSAEVRRRVQEILRTTGTLEKIDGLIQILGQPGAAGPKLEETRQAIEDLVKFGPVAVPQLVEAIRNGHNTAGPYSANALDEIRTPAVEIVRREWDKLGEVDRWKLMRFRGQFDYKEALNFALDSLESPHNDVRRQAIAYLGQYKETKARDALIKKLDTELPELRWLCVHALTEIGGDEVIDAFIKLLAPKTWVAKGEGLVPPLGKSPPWWPDGRPVIIESLRKLKAKKAAPALLRLLQEKGEGKAYLGSLIIPALEEFEYSECVPELKRIIAAERKDMARDIDQPDRIKNRATKALLKLEKGN